MNRKYNPWVSLVALLLAAIILVLTCAGCAPAHAAAETETEPAARFIYERAGHAPGDAFYIITDTETGVQYLAWDAYNGGAMTVLLPGEE